MRFWIVQGIAPIKAPSERVGKSSYSLGLKIRIERAQRQRGFTPLVAGVYRPPPSLSHGRIRLTKRSMDIGPMLKGDLLRQPKLFFQIFDQLIEALSGDGVVSQGSRPLGLLQPPLKFFSVALFNHGDTLLSIRRGSGAM